MLAFTFRIPCFVYYLLVCDNTIDRAEVEGEGT